MAPSPSSARPVTIVLLVGIALIHVLTLPEAFRSEAYLGVFVMLAIGMALAGGAALLVRDSAGVWWYVLFDGTLNFLGYVMTHTGEMPLVSDNISRSWDEPHGLALGFFTVLVMCLATWMLVARRFPPDIPPGPVTSARQRSAVGEPE